MKIVFPYTGVSKFASRTSPNTRQSLQKSFYLSPPDKIELKNIPTLLKIKKKQSHKPTQTNMLTANFTQ
jgi:hypothetical protein